MATQSPLKVASQTASSVVSNIRDWAQQTMIAGRPCLLTALKSVGAGRGK